MQVSSHDLEFAIDSSPPKYRIVMLFPVLPLTDHQPHGDGLVAFSFISQLVDRGHDVHVIAQNVDIRSPLPPNLHIHQVGLGTRGIRQRLSFLIESRRVVRRLQKTQKVEIIHQLNPVLSGMSLGMIGLGVPVVLGTFVAKWAFKAANPKVYKKVFRRRKTIDVPARVLKRCGEFLVGFIQEHFASAFLVTTRAALSRFTSSARVETRVHWIPHGLDIGLFSPKPSVSAARSILFVGMITVNKGIHTLLDAFEIVRAELPDVRLIIVGRAVNSDSSTRRLLAAPVSPNLIFRGELSRQEVSELMATSSVYCQPSFGEPYGMAVLEAMACGRPVVVTDTGGLAELVDDRGGRRVQAGDAEALAAALIEILSAPELQRQMGTHNREVAERVYDWPRIVGRLETAYGEVMSKSRSGASTP